MKKAVIREYILLLLFLLAVLCFAEKAVDLLIGENRGIDAIGNAIVAAFLVNGVIVFFAVLLMGINPVRIVIKYRQDLKNTENTGKRMLWIIVILLPILLGLRIVFAGFIDNYQYDHRYNHSKYDYVVEPENYRTVQEFQKELEDRGFLYQEKDAELISLMNDNSQHFYMPGVFSGETSERYTPTAVEFDAQQKRYVLPEKALSRDSGERYPWYAYRASLMLPHDSSRLVYAPVYDAYGDRRINPEDDCPFFDDYYIDCEFFYVNGDLYAVIGVYDAWQAYHDRFTDERSADWMYPYCMVLSEKETITTWVDGKYHGQGSLTKGYSDLQMHVNENVPSYFNEKYEIRTVERLDVETINALAQELRETVLKEGVEEYLQGRKENF